MKANSNILHLALAVVASACAMTVPATHALAQESATTAVLSDESEGVAAAAAARNEATTGESEAASADSSAETSDGELQADARKDSAAADDTETDASSSVPGTTPDAAIAPVVPDASGESLPEDDIRVARLDETGRSDETGGALDDADDASDEGAEEALLENEVALDAPVVDASDRLLPIVPLADAVTTADQANSTLQLLGETIPPGTTRRLAWSATELFEGVTVSTPVLVVNGVAPGPTLCLSAAVHGDELNGIEIVRRVMHDLNPDKLAGRVIGIPIVNLQGFRRGSRYLPDRRDLNRSFPGNTRGSAAARIAYSFFNEIVLHCDALIDLHTGSFERRNLPQLRANLRNPDVVTLTQGFGSTVILHSTPGKGTLRYAATLAGVPTVTLEAGGPLELELNEVRHGVKGIETLLHTLGMVKRVRLWGDPEPVYYRSSWVRANRGGILLADVSLGSTVRRGDLLGSITDPMNNATTNLYSPFAGRVIGMARNQVVMPGFAAFHIGIASEDVALPEPESADPDNEEEGDSAYPDGISED